MKKMTIGIVTLMMVFGTITANGSTNAKNDKKNKPHVVEKVHKGPANDIHAVVHNAPMPGNGTYYGAGYGTHANVNNHNHWGRVAGDKMFVDHCMKGHKMDIGKHKHSYAYEVVNGYMTNHKVCVFCGKHIH